MARALSYENYGSYGQTILIISFASTLLAFGLSKVIFIYLNDESKDKKVVSFNNIINGFIIGILGALILYTASEWISNWFNNPTLSNYIKIYAFSIVFSIPNLSINSYLIYQEKVKQSIILLITSNLLKVILIVISIQVYHSLPLIFASIILSEAIRFTAGVFVTKKELKFKLDYSLMRNQIKSGFPLAFSGILGVAIIYTDGLMVSKFLGVKEYAIYRNGAIEVPFIATLYGAISTIIMPEVSKLWSNKNHLEIKNLKFKVINYTAVLIYPVMIFFLFNSLDFITLYVGEKYEDSAMIFMIFNLTLLFRVNDYEDVLIASGNTTFILKIYVLILLFNIVLNYFFINWWGSMGAAISTVTSVFLLLLILLRKTTVLIKARISELLNVKVILMVLSISIVYALLIKLLMEASVINSKIKFILTTIIYFSSIYFSLFKLKVIPRDLLDRLIPFKNMRKKF